MLQSIVVFLDVSWLAVATKVVVKVLYLLNEILAEIDRFVITLFFITAVFGEVPVRRHTFGDVEASAFVAKF